MQTKEQRKIAVDSLVSSLIKMLGSAEARS
jgi:hypothetical protein